MAAITGARSTLYDGAINASQLVRDVDKDITNVELDMDNSGSALFTLLNETKNTQETTATKFEWPEDLLNDRDGLVGAAGWTKNQTVALSVVAGLDSYIQAGTLLLVPSTMERLLVTSRDTTAHTFAAIRNVGAGITGTDGATEGCGIATVSGDNIRILADIFEEGSGMATSITRNLEFMYNYVETIQTAVSFTDIENAVELYGTGKGDEAYQNKKKGIEHKEKINADMWSGVRRQVQGPDGHAMRSTGGVFQFVQGNILDISGGIYGGTLTMRALRDFTDMLSENPGSGSKTVFTSSFIGSAIDNLLQNQVRTTNSISKLGVRCSTFEMSGLEMNIVRERKVFYGDLVGWMVALDTPYLKFRPLRGFNTKFQRGIRLPGSKKFSNEYTTTWGLQLRGWGMDAEHVADTTGPFRGVHGILKGATKY